MLVGCDEMSLMIVSVAFGLEFGMPCGAASVMQRGGEGV